MLGLLTLAALSPQRLATLLERLPVEARRGRPWALSRRDRILLTCVALRTNLTFRELAAIVGISKSAAHRAVAETVRPLATLAGRGADPRSVWVLDGTLIPTRDHTAAARAKNYRQSCNAQIVIRHRDLRVVATTAGGPGNRNDPVHYRGSVIQRLCREHGSPTVATAVSPSSSPRCFAGVGSCAITCGDDIGAVAPGSITRSRA